MAKHRHITPKASHSITPDAVGRLIGYFAARQMVAQYDSLKRGANEGRPKLDRKTDFSRTEQEFRADKRIESYLQADDLFDNSSSGSTLETVVRLTVGTTGGTPIFEGENAEELTRWWKAWSKSCGYCEGESWQEMLRQIIRTVKLHGDCLVVCSALTGYKVRVYDADQICNVSDFPAYCEKIGVDWKTCRQVEGVVVNATGKVLGYFVTCRRNHYAVSNDDATFLPVCECRRVSEHKLPTEYRGRSALLRNQRVTDDTKELLKAEIGAARLASEMPLIVEQPSGVNKDMLAGILEGFSDPSAVAASAGVTDDEIAQLDAMAKADTHAFDAFGGKAAVASVQAGTKVTNLNNSARPSQPIQNWVNLLDDTNGKSMGLMSCLSRGRADNSYSSGQIELEISWKAIAENQNMLERLVVDYVLSEVAPDSDYSVMWDSAFSLDPEKDERVKDMRLHGGRTTFRELLGAGWRKKLEQLAEEKKALEQLDLTNLSFWQTSSGASIEEPTPEQPELMPQGEPLKETDNAQN